MCKVGVSAPLKGSHLWSKGKQSIKIWNALSYAMCLTLFSVAVTEYHGLNHKAYLVSCSGSQEVHDGVVTSIEALPAAVDSLQDHSGHHMAKQSKLVYLDSLLFLFKITSI